MSVSTAVSRLASVVAQVEDGERTIEGITIREVDAQRKKMDVEIEVCIAVTEGVMIDDGVEIKATNPEISDGKMTTTVSCTIDVPQNGQPSSEVTSELSEAPDSNLHRDPEALRTVYKKYDTFSEMTKALGADVTPETVRRNMVKHGIHDPDDSPSSTVPSSSTGNSLLDSKHKDSQQISSMDNMPVVDLLSYSESSEKEKIADGSGIPENLTVGEVVDIVNQTRTIHDVKKRLDVDSSQVCPLLKSLGIIEFVSVRLNSNKAKASKSDIKQAIVEELELKQVTSTS